MSDNYAANREPMFISDTQQSGRDRVRVIRVLEFIGPKEWIETTLQRSYVRGDVSNKFGGDGREVRELACIQEPVTEKESNVR